VSTSTERTDAANTKSARAEVKGRSTVEHDRIIEADGARHAVAELGAVLDVVHAGDGVMAAEQERGVVARITMPRRRVGRGRFTEGEASELDEHHFDRDIAFAGVVQQASTRTYAR